MKDDLMCPILTVGWFAGGHKASVECRVEDCALWNDEKQCCSMCAVKNDEKDN
jgi:hypothetical protein